MTTDIMNGTYFNNPVKTLHRLKEVGFTENQAELQIDILSDYVKNGLATKKDFGLFENSIKLLEGTINRDFRLLESSMNKDFRLLESSVGKDFKLLESDFDLKLKKLELTITVKTAAIVGSIVGFFYLIDRFF